MITLVELQNWRSYQDAIIDLSAKVVFFVAPNGVGKSSLVEAVRWCLLGEPNERRAKAAVRLGRDSATVAVEVDLGNDSELLRVRRSLTAKGRSTFEAFLGGSSLTHENYKSLLADRWSADHGLIDRLMFTDPLLPPAKSAFPVRDNLAATLGVTPLLDGASQLDIFRREAADRVGDLRDEVGAAEAELALFEETTTSAAAELATVGQQQQKLAAEIRAAETGASLAARWNSYREAVDSHNRAAADIVAELGEVVELNENGPLQSIDNARFGATAALAEARDTKASQDIAKAKSAGASELLADPIDACPTCLRPLTELERSRALAQHGETMAHAETDDSAVLQEASATARLELLAIFTTRLASLQEPSAPAEPDPGPEAREQLTRLRVRDLELAENAGRISAAVAAEADRAALAERLDQRRIALRQAANEEQLLLTASGVLSDLADKTLRDRIEPLIAELSRRWKLLFGAEGLTLEPSGELTIKSDAGTLAITDLSGGERATAILISRLLITAATTRIPTVWFDEPLEHLDPRRRAAVARTIIRAGQTDTVAQVIVTTYEDRIARQLASADPDTVRVVHADGPRPS